MPPIRDNLQSGSTTWSPVYVCAHVNVCFRASFACFPLDFDEMPNKRFLVLNSNAFETKTVISLIFIHIQVYKALSWAHHTYEPHSQLTWQV